tara:strand:+ start:16 stop:372 length:357 start_codon:yes stop_codon:yes gene_type:complete
MDEDPEIETYEGDEYEDPDIIVETKVNEDINLLMKDYKRKLKNYHTSPTLTKYERTRILAERATQIDEGAQVLIAGAERYRSAYEIAVAEFNDKKIPFIVKRPYGNTFEYWKLKDLIL